MTIFDQQTGKLISGTPQNITAFTFELVSNGQVFVFPVDHLPPDLKP